MILVGDYSISKLYNQLSEIERGKIEACLKEGKSISEIARLIKRSQNQLFQKRSKEVGAMVNILHILHRMDVQNEYMNHVNIQSGKMQTFYTL